jgi:hypothetical protein
LIKQGRLTGLLYLPTSGDRAPQLSTRTPPEQNLIWGAAKRSYIYLIADAAASM